MYISNADTIVQKESQLLDMNVHVHDDEHVTIIYDILGAGEFRSKDQLIFYHEHIGNVIYHNEVSFCM